MAVTLNLLPPELAVSGPLGKVLKTVRMINVILLAGFIVFSLGLFGFFIFSRIELNSATSANDQLKNQILAQEQSETQIVLLKDRIGKIKTIQNIPSSIKNFQNVEPYVTALGSDSTLSELNVDSQKTDITVLFKSNSGLSDFIQSLKSSQVFTSINISSFGFNPLSGYLVTVNAK